MSLFDILIQGSNNNANQYSDHATEKDDLAWPALTCIDFIFYFNT